MHLLFNKFCSCIISNGKNTKIKKIEIDTKNQESLKDVNQKNDIYFKKHIFLYKKIYY